MPFQYHGQPVDLHGVVIESDRLCLKPISTDDTAAIFHNFTPTVTRYMIPEPPQTIGDTEAFVTMALAGLERGDNLHLVIRLRGNDEFLGLCGLHERGDVAEPEMGIWLKIDAHGYGYGREAVTTLKHWAERNIDFERLIYPVDRRNIPSRKIPEMLGGKRIAEQKTTSVAGTELDEVVYAISRAPPNGT